jgi:hypothetical protein
MMRLLFYVVVLALVIVSCQESASPEASKAADGHEGHNHENYEGQGMMMSAKPTYADSVNDGTIPKDTLKPSVRRVAMENVGDCHVHIDYGSPGVRGRSIWGGLVAYNEVWVAGAHSATSVRFSKDVQVAGKKIAAGTYGFFAVPGAEKWELILNTRYKQHLTDEYKQEEDVVRVSAVPEKINQVQRLTYRVQSSSDKAALPLQGSIVLSWDTLQVQLPFTVLQ